MSERRSYVDDESSAELQTVEGGQHFLTASDPETANAATLAFVEKWS